jgi:hypothetical protein
LLIHQPFFIGGIKDVDDAKNSAFGAAGTFFLTFLISIIYLIADNHYGLGDMRNLGSIRNNMRPLRSQYGLVSTVQEHHDSDDEEEHELGAFT